MKGSLLDCVFPTQKEPAGNTANPAITAGPCYIQGTRIPAKLTLVSIE